MAELRDPGHSRRSERLRLVSSSSGEREVTAHSDGQLRPGEVVGGYRIEDLINSGALARVYRATQLSTGRVVALKLLLTRYLADGAVRRRMRLQARALARVQHANVVTVYDVSVDGEVMWMAMELLPGTTLRRALRQRSETGKRASLEEALHVGLQIAAALQAAHSVGVVHGDLKPENIFVLEGAIIKVADFTTATFLNAGDLTEPTERPDTVPDFKGTPRAMAPELFYAGFQPDPRSDVYSLGLILYEMLAGRHLIPEQSPFEQTRWLQLQVPPKCIPGIPPRLWQLVAAMLSKDPNRRPSLRSVARRLRAEERALTPAPSAEEPLLGTRERSVLLGGMLGITIGAVLFALQHWHDDRPSGPSAPTPDQLAHDSTSP